MNTESIKLIKLPNGNTLEVSIFPGFLEKVKEHFSLRNIEEVNDDHVRMYIYGAFKSAIDNQ
jgi:hypothetical protein